MQKKIKSHVLDQLLKINKIYHITTYGDASCIPDGTDIGWHYANINQFKILYQTGGKKTKRVTLTAFNFLDIHFTWATLKASTLNELWIGHPGVTVKDIELMQKLYNCQGEFTEVPLLDITSLKYD